jgi:hypothetical protein
MEKLTKFTRKQLEQRERHAEAMRKGRLFGGERFWVADAGAKGWMEELAEGFRKRGVKARLVPDRAVPGDYQLYINKTPAMFRGKNGAPAYNVNPFPKWEKRGHPVRRKK